MKHKFRHLVDNQGVIYNIDQIKSGIVDYAFKNTSYDLYNKSHLFYLEYLSEDKKEIKAYPFLNQSKVKNYYSLLHGSIPGKNFTAKDIVVKNAIAMYFFTYSTPIMAGYTDLSDITVNENDDIASLIDSKSAKDKEFFFSERLPELLSEIKDAQSLDNALALSLLGCYLYKLIGVVLNRGKIYNFFAFMDDKNKEIFDPSRITNFLYNSLVKLLEKDEYKYIMDMLNNKYKKFSKLDWNTNNAQILKLLDDYYLIENICQEKYDVTVNKELLDKSCSSKTWFNELSEIEIELNKVIENIK